jgi:hypothetical protein
LRAKVAWHAEERILEKSMRQVDFDRTSTATSFEMERNRSTLCMGLAGREAALVEAVQQGYINRVSTRTIEQPAKRLG